MKQIRYFDIRGFGDSLIGLMTLSRLAIKNNTKIKTWTNYTRIYKDKLQIFQPNTSVILEYFKPKEYILDYEYISPGWYPLKHYLKDYSNIQQNMLYPHDSSINYIVKSKKFQFFNDEFNQLDHKYDLSNRIPVHLRLFRNNYFIARNFIQALGKMNKNEKYMIATDNIYWYDTKIKPLLKDYNIFMLDIPRGTEQENIEYMDVENFKQHRINTLKEAYFMSKCRLDKMICSKSNFSKFIRMLPKIKIDDGGQY